MMSILRASLLMVGAPLLILSAAPMASGLPVGRELADQKSTSTVKHIGKETQAVTGVKVSTGLPGVTPAKKSTAAANEPANAPYANYKNLLQDAVCPLAAVDPEIKDSLECKAHAIRMELNKVDGLSAVERAGVLHHRVALFQDAGKASAEDQRLAKAASIKLYQKAFALYCVGDKKTSSDLCTNPLMLKMYGGA